MKTVMPEKSRTEYEEIITEWIFSERDRAIVRRKLLDGLTYEKIAEEFDLSVQQVKRIYSRSQGIILSHS